MSADKNKKPTLARSLGLFVGSIVRGATGDSVEPRRHEVRREVTEEEKETSQGTVTLRRTVIEEVELGGERGQRPTIRDQGESAS